MTAIWGHVVSVVNQPNYPPILVLNTRTPLGTLRAECVVGEDTKLLKGLEQLNLDEIRPGDFVMASFVLHSGWLVTERIEVIVSSYVQ